jgi:ribonuclease-3 family protein
VSFGEEDMANEIGIDNGIFGETLDSNQLKSINTLGLAYVGDAVYELFVRIRLCKERGCTNSTMHKQAVRRVNAAAQARAGELLMSRLTDEEKDVCRRGRNTDYHSKPKNVSHADYAAATGFETLFGWLWMTGRQERAYELFRFLWDHEPRDGGPAQMKGAGDGT